MWGLGGVPAHQPGGAEVAGQGEFPYPVKPPTPSPGQLLCSDSRYFLLLVGMIRNLSGPGAAVDPGSLEERGGGERRAGYTCY